ncbi:MAG: glycoside hydrolase family 38 C-terminal domain-containing protein, partial [Armatimonadota bacterium]
LLQPDAVKHAAAFMRTHPGTVAFGTFEEYANDTNWDEAELLKGEHNAEFTGCYTTRIELKQLNQAAETSLYNAEFLHAMAVLGGVASPDPDARKTNWRDLFLCQFHDALCGCHIDDNYHDIIAAFDRIRDDISGAIAGSFDPPTGLESLAVLNTLPFARTDIVRVDSISTVVYDCDGVAVFCQRDDEQLVFAASLQPGGSRTYRTAQSDTPMVQPIGGDAMQVGRFCISLQNGKIEITDTRNDGRHIFRRDDIPMKIVLKEDVGTLWTENYTGKVIEEEPDDSMLIDAEIGPVFARIVFRGGMPKSKVSWDSFGNLTWEKAIYVYRDIDRIDVTIDINFEGKGTEISTVIPVDIYDGEDCAIYEIPFGSIERKPYAPDKYRWARGNWPALSWIDYSDADWGLAIAHTGTPGCLSADGRVSFSILRSAMVSEPPIFPTEPEPLSFDNGEHHYEFSLIPHECRSDEWLRRAREFIVRPVTAQSDGHRLPSVLVEIDQPNVVLSSLKAAEDGNGVVMRIFETLGKPCTACITLGVAVGCVLETSLDERTIMGSVDLGAVEMKAYGIRTLVLQLGSV